MVLSAHLAGAIVRRLERTPLPRLRRVLPRLRGTPLPRLRRVLPRLRGTPLPRPRRVLPRLRGTPLPRLRRVLPRLRGGESPLALSPIGRRAPLRPAARPPNQPARSGPVRSLQVGLPHLDAPYRP